MAPATLTPPRTRRQQGTGSGLGKPWRVIVLNDNHNTVEGVAFALSSVLPGVGYDQGMKLANRIHSTGQAIGWSGYKVFVLGILILTPLLQSYLYIQNYFFEQLAQSFEFINSIKFLLDSLNELIEKTFGNLLRTDNFVEVILVIITISIIPAFCEQVMFRGFIQRSFGFKFEPFIAALLTAIFFALYHFNPYGLIPLAIIRFYLGFAAYSSQSLVITIIIHFLNNFFAVMLYFIIGDDELFKSNVSDAASLNTNIIYFVVLTVSFIVLMIIIKKYYIIEK